MNVGRNVELGDSPENRRKMSYHQVWGISMYFKRWESSGVYLPAFFLNDGMAFMFRSLYYVHRAASKPCSYRYTV